MTYLPTLLGLLTAFCWGTSDYLSRSQSQRVGYYRTTVYMHLMTFVIMLLLFPLLQSRVVLTLGAALVMTVASVVNFFAFIFLYRAFHRGVVSIVAPLAYTYPAVTTILAVVLLGAVLTVTTTLALASIMLGVILLSTRFSELSTYLKGKGPPKLTTGVGSAVMAALSFGIVYIGIGYVTPIIGYVLPVLMLRGIGTLVGFSIAPLFRERSWPDRASFSNIIVVMGILESVGFLSFNFGISLGASSLPVVAAISGMGGAVATAYAISFLRERLERNQVIGLVLAVGGVFALLSLGG